MGRFQLVGISLLLVAFTHAQTTESSAETTDFTTPMPTSSGDVFEVVDDCRAPKIYDPVCASNGKKYSNKHIFNCANKLANGTLTITKSRGNCSSTTNEQSQDDPQTTPEAISVDEK